MECEMAAIQIRPIVGDELEIAILEAFANRAKYVERMLKIQNETIEIADYIPMDEITNQC